MATIDRETGKELSGLDDVWQSIGTILSTPLKALVFARDFGSLLPRMVDRALNPITLIEFFAAFPEAVNRINPETLMMEEPRFRVRRMKLSTDSDIPNGRAIFDVEGVYFPRGHLGDYSIAEDAFGQVVVVDSTGG